MGDDKNPNVGVRIGLERREHLEEIAHERSEPGENVTISDVIRDAIDEFLTERDRVGDRNALQISTTHEK